MTSHSILHAVPFTLTHESATVIVDGKPYTVQKGAPNFHALRDAIVEERWDDIPKHITVAKSLKEWAKGCFAFNPTNNTVSFGGMEVPSNINQRLLQMAAKGEDPTPVFNFWERLQRNPSFRSVQQLWDFMQHEGIPLTADGCLLAYKSVKMNYKDHYSGQFDNSPGQINKMPRSQISDDPKIACHDGFHVGAYGYASTFGDSPHRIMIVKVDPMNVVCVPYDSSAQKMRVCEYEVIGHHNDAGIMPSTTMTTPAEEEFDEDDGDKPGYRVVDLTGGTLRLRAVRHHPRRPPLRLAWHCQPPQMDREADKGLMPVGSKGKKSKKPPTAKKPTKSFSKLNVLNKMSMGELLKLSINDLRQYATKGLDIVGASKIPGGKSALVTRILKVRE